MVFLLLKDRLYENRARGSRTVSEVLRIGLVLLVARVNFQFFHEKPDLAIRGFHSSLPFNPH